MTRQPLAILLRRARRRPGREGAAAVEFAMIGGLFFLMLFALFEIAMVFTVDSVLQSATTDTSRLVRTGEAASQGFDAAKFKAALCDRMGVFASDCDNRATVRVETVVNFDTPPPPPPEPDELTDDYDGGEPGELMQVTVWYAQPVLTPFLDQGVSRHGYTALLTATTAFRNEPWATPAPIGG